MTSPERLRRRQIRESIGLAVLGVLVAGSSVYNQHSDSAQKDCLRTQVVALSRAFSARSDLNETDSASKTRVITRVAKAQTSTDVRAALDDFLKEQHKINAERDRHPAPPFPSGTCD